MELEKQVCSLELAKRLKELGVKQKSLFYWYWDGERDVLVQSKEVASIKDDYAAFTVAELGEMLPNGLRIIVNTSRGINCWYCEAEHIPKIMRERLHLVQADTEADARAEMLVHLLENDLLR